MAKEVPKFQLPGYGLYDLWICVAQNGNRGVVYEIYALLAFNVGNPAAFTAPNVYGVWREGYGMAGVAAGHNLPGTIVEALGLGGW